MIFDKQKTAPIYHPTTCKGSVHLNSPTKKHMFPVLSGANRQALYLCAVSLLNEPTINISM